MFWSKNALRALRTLCFGGKLIENSILNEKFASCAALRSLVELTMIGLDLDLDLKLGLELDLVNVFFVDDDWNVKL